MRAEELCLLPDRMDIEARKRFGEDIFERLRKPVDDEDAEEKEKVVGAFFEWFTKEWIPGLRSGLQPVEWNVGRCVENVDRVSRRREEAPKVQTALLGSRDDERRHVVSAASTIQDYEGGRRVFDVISQEEAVEVDCDRCLTRGGVPVGSLVRCHYFAYILRDS